MSADKRTVGAKPGKPQRGRPAKVVLRKSGRLEEQLRRLVRSALRVSGRTQKSLAAHMGWSEKHISHILCGRSHLPVDLADRMLRFCGFAVHLAVECIDDGDIDIVAGIPATEEEDSGG